MLLGWWGLAAKWRHLEILPAFSRSGGGGGGGGDFTHARSGYSHPHKDPKGTAGRGDMHVPWDLSAAGEDRDGDFARCCVSMTRPQQLAEARREQVTARVLLDTMVLFLRARLRPKFSWCSLSSSAAMGTGYVPSCQTRSGSLVLRVRGAQPRQTSPCPMHAAIQPRSFPHQSIS